MTVESVTVTGIRARPVLVPIRRPVQTAKFSIPSVPLVLLDVETSAGVTGRAYVMAFAEWVFKPLIACIEAAATMIDGQPLAPVNIQALLRQKLLLLGTSGITSIAVGGIDMALWDALAKSKELPLASLLGGEPSTLQT